MLHDNGIKTYAFIGPVLPMNPEALLKKIIPHVDSVIIDRIELHFKDSANIPTNEPT